MNDFNEILKTAREVWPKFEEYESNCELINISYLRMRLYANDNMLQVLDKPYLRLLQANLLIHFFIVNPDSPLYVDFNIGSQDFLVTSVSSAGASTSINSIKALDEGDFLTLDLNRTRFGREAYQIMSSLSGVAIL